MIEHLRGRDRKLEPLGWTGAGAEWIALVCLHSGVFMRGQFCDYFGASRQQAQRFVKALIQRREAVENPHISFSGGTKPCRISSNAIYRALGVKNIRNRRSATKTVLMRQLLSLDFVLKHPSINWLPAEPEKVEFFEKLGVPLRLIPRRIYCGVVGAQKRYFAIKLPLAVEPTIVTFVYVDPGHQTHTELYSWGAAHGPLWDALREKGRRVRVIGIAVENAILDRTNRVLERWAAAEPGTSHELTPEQEIKAIDDAMTHNDENFLAQYGGFGKAVKRSALLQGWGMTPEQEIKAIEAAMERNDLAYLDRRYGGFGEAMRRAVAIREVPEAKLTEGVSIDDFSTWRAVRFADQNEVG